MTTIMMKTTISALLPTLYLLTCVNAFVPHPYTTVLKSTKLAVLADLPAVTHVESNVNTQISQSSASSMEIGVANWLDDANSVSVSLSERKAPTAEEVAEKKKNFNLWFWGGGFVAPFLATFYYFGLKFWKY